MKFTKYLSTQAIDEGFTPQEKPGKNIFYRTKDWVRYKEFKGHKDGLLTTAQRSRYDRHAVEISKLIKGSKRVLSLGGALDR